MKIRTTLSLAIIAVPFVFATSAQAAAQAVQRTAQDTTKTEQQAQLKQRLEERKAKLKTTLSTIEKNRITAKCMNSQGKLKSLGNRIAGIQTSREKVYDNLVNRLTSLKTKLQDRGADVTKLTSDITALEAKIATYEADLAAYKQAVSDLSTMDCKADPVAFKASLETARTALAKVRQDAKDIKAFVNNDIKATLKAIRATLEKTTGEGEE